MESKRTLLKQLYKNDAERILEAINTYKKTLPQIENQKRNPSWYKTLEMYVMYPDGIMHNQKISKLRNLISHILYIKTLGCNAIHILPFLESPLVDRGFDIRDYYKIRNDLGSLTDLQAVLKEAKKAQLHVFMDLVFNHVSDQHSWFQKAQSGDETYRNYFITTNKKPLFLGLQRKENAVWARYVVKGKEIEVNVAFPEFIGEIPHWRQGKNGYWYYHTYFPQELDLNWHNPNVFIEAAKIMLYWGSMGFHFRFDAIPFIGKSAYKNETDESENTFLITAALKTIAEENHPYTAFLVETYESLDKVMGYFGSEQRMQANLAYNFHLCTTIWISLVTENTKNIWQTLEKEKDIPQHASWVNFLRNHDELSLAYLDETLTQTMNNHLLRYGEPFRESYGIAGRTFSLIGSRYKRYLMAYFLLASFPGGIAIPYGDEIAFKNTPLYKMQDWERTDPRNMNRGIITTKDFNKPQAKKISETFSAILAKRKELHVYLCTWPKKISAPKEIFAARYTDTESELLVYVNLSKKPVQLRKKFTGFQKVAGINAHSFHDEKIILGPYAGVWMKRLR